MHMYFSLIIPTYNGESTIGLILENLEIHKDYIKDIVIIDSSSTDSTREIISAYNKQLPITLKIIPKKNFNHGITRNQAVRISKGKYVLFLSQDVLLPTRTFFKRMIKAFDISSNVVAIIGQQKPYNNTPINEKLDIMAYYNSLNKLCNNKSRLYIADPARKFSQNTNASYNYLSLSDAFCSYRRNFLLKNPFPNVSYGEDMYLAREIFKQKKVVVYDSKTTITHSNRLSFLEYIKRLLVDYKYRAHFKHVKHGVYAHYKIQYIRKLNDPLYIKARYMLQLAIVYVIKIILKLFAQISYKLSNNRS